MRYASTYDKSGASVVAELRGDLLVPLAGLTELGGSSTAEVLAAAERRSEDAFPAVGAALRPVVPNPAKVICIGLNYKAHIEETGRSDSDYPVLFPKFASSLAGPFAELELPAESHQIDYEGELTVVIGKPGRRISEADAAGHILGYTVANDISMRDFALRPDTPFGIDWIRSKGYATCLPMGPAVVPSRFVRDPQVLPMRLWVGDELMQDSNTSEMLFSVAEQIEFLSAIVPLLPGDVISTGTPAGVGFARDRFLQPGEVIVAEIVGVGRLVNRVA